MSYLEIDNTDYDNVSDLNYAIALAAQSEGWIVKSVPAYNAIYTSNDSFPPFVPIVAFGLSKSGGSSGVLLTPPDFPSYIPPPGYDRQDMSTPSEALLFIPSFMSGGIDGFNLDIAQAAPLGTHGWYLYWYPPDYSGDQFYKVTRPTRGAWTALWYIGVALGIESTAPSFGGYIMQSPPINGVSVTVWLDNGFDLNDVDNETFTRFYVTGETLAVAPHPRTDAGKPMDSSAVQTLLAANQAATVYVNSQNLWSMANEVKFGIIPHWYAMNIKPRPDLSDAVMLAGETVAVGPRYLTTAPVWWLKLNGINYIRPTDNINMQLGRLYSYAGADVPIKWDDDITECLESFVFIFDISNTVFAICGLITDVLIAHSSVAADQLLTYDGDTFIKVAGSGGAGIMVRN